MSQAFVDDLTIGQGMKKVEMKEQHNKDCIGVWFLAASDSKSSEDISVAINEHLFAIRMAIGQMSTSDFNGLKNTV